MIRTAILAGIFLVLLSIAYGRPGAWPENVQKVAALVDEQPVAKAPVSASTPAPAHKQAAPVSAPRPDRAVTPPAVAAIPVTPAEPSPPAEIARKEEAIDVPAPVAPPPVVTPALATVAQDARPLPPQPKSLIPPESPHTQVASMAQSPSALRNPIPLVPPADEPARVVSPAPPPAAEMPLINVPVRPVVTPWEAPPRPPAATTVAAANVAPSETPVKQAGDAAPKLMTPQERSRELYRLAREMEDTFIRKLAR